MSRIILLSLIFISVMGIAQDGPTVVVFNSSSSKEPDYWSKHNLIKFNVFEAFSGDFAFYYERILNENFSVEGGLGVTMSDYFSMMWSDNFDFSDETVQPLMGFSFLAGGRYYPYRAADEFYFAPEFKYRYYHNLKTYTDFGGIEQEVEESRTLFTGRVSFGYVYFFDDNIFIDYSAGFGISRINDASLEENYNSVTGQFEYTVEENSRLAPRFHMGLKIGVAF
ncbi:MAG: hypothetical protein IPM74_14970 [Crocinitomicaceae bacterium]|nr:hypothetical protein [Crocinitomicaceae bacterium]MBK8927173.1 hypothetical protein [Crocinitomicaceae bacterium]